MGSRLDAAAQGTGRVERFQQAEAGEDVTQAEITLSKRSPFEGRSGDILVEHGDSHFSAGFGYLLGDGLAFMDVAVAPERGAFRSVDGRARVEMTGRGGTGIGSQAQETEGDEENGETQGDIKAKVCGVGLTVVGAECQL
ncbi:hypothetical protein IWQ60_010807 [Tieghemiomyces parasiticus]|uniref:Uncharacterized protein n=1 Tax=Tieghemiomyces parasiticus TaxID=78921 RepID=A0A9W8DMG0_9FUNG|nr:hypothetical protein IWQ60_010807 [Tieghemiomyces parasiticus]